MTTPRPLRQRPAMPRRRVLGLGIAALAFLACGSDDGSVPSGASDDGGSDTGENSGGGTGVRVTTPEQAAAIIDENDPDLFILDVRTPEEFEEVRIDGAELIDIQEPDFADQIQGLDRDVPYVLYCRSGNRSARARELMGELGFGDVADIDGGIVAWVDAGLPTVSGPTDS